MTGNSGQNDNLLRVSLCQSTDRPRSPSYDPRAEGSRANGGSEMVSCLTKPRRVQHLMIASSRASEQLAALPRQSRAAPYLPFSPPPQESLPHPASPPFNAPRPSMGDFLPPPGPVDFALAGPSKARTSHGIELEEEEDILEEDEFQLARTYFDMKEFDRVVFTLRDARGSRARFLRVYAAYLVSELCLYASEPDPLTTAVGGPEGAGVSPPLPRYQGRTNSPVSGAQPPCRRARRRDRAVPRVSSGSFVHASGSTSGGGGVLHTERARAAVQLELLESAGADGQLCRTREVVDTASSQQLTSA